MRTITDRTELKGLPAGHYVVAGDAALAIAEQNAAAMIAEQKRKGKKQKRK